MPANLVLQTLVPLLYQLRIGTDLSKLIRILFQGIYCAQLHFVGESLDTGEMCVCRGEERRNVVPHMHTLVPASPGAEIKASICLNIFEATVNP